MEKLKYTNTCACAYNLNTSMIISVDVSQNGRLRATIFFQWARRVVSGWKMTLNVSMPVANTYRVKFAINFHFFFHFHGQYDAKKYVRFYFIFFFSNLFNAFQVLRIFLLSHESIEHIDYIFLSSLMLRYLFHLRKNAFAAK